MARKSLVQESAVSCHFVNCIKAFKDTMLIELLVYDPVVFVSRPLLGHDKATADRATNFVPKFTKKQSGRDVGDECTMVSRAVQEWQHAHIQDLYFW